MKNSLVTKLSTFFLSLIFLLIVVSFLFGNYDGFTAASSQDVASVDGLPVTTREYQMRLSQQVEFFSQMMGGQMTQQQMEQMGIKDTVLSGLVQQKLLLSTGRKMGLALSEAELKDEIKKLKETLKQKEEQLKHKDSEWETKNFKLQKDHIDLLDKVASMENYISETKSKNLNKQNSEIEQSQKFESHLKEKQQTLNALTLRLENLDQNLKNKDQKLHEKDLKIKSLNEKLSEWNNVVEAFPGSTIDPTLFLKWKHRAVEGKRMYNLMRMLRDLSDEKLIGYQDQIKEISSKYFKNESIKDLHADVLLSKLAASIEGNFESSNTQFVSTNTTNSSNATLS
jgi:DNA repair exonuclease SbcCD ATPase subunit